jgi:hypothetical protein
VFPHEGGGNKAGHHRRAVGRAERASWADREAEARWGEGGDGQLKRKKMGCSWAERPDGPAGRWADWAESEEKLFSE